MVAERSDVGCEIGDLRGAVGWVHAGGVIVYEWKCARLMHICGDLL